MFKKLNKKDIKFELKTKSGAYYSTTILNVPRSEVKQVIKNEVKRFGENGIIVLDIDW